MDGKSINVLKPMKHEHLLLLLNRESTGSFEFINRKLDRVAKGFSNDVVVFKEGDFYFKFMAVRYLENEVMFTVPFQVFPEKVTYTHTTYSNQVKKGE